MNEDLPVSLCATCSLSAINAAEFRRNCRQAANKWDAVLQLLDTLTKNREKCKTLFAVIDSDQIVMINDNNNFSNSKSAAKRLSMRVNPEKKQKAVDVTVKKHRCQCPDCGKKFLYEQQFYQHLKESTDFKRACYICAKIMTRDELVLHLREEHNHEPYDCKKCPALLRSYSQYMQHLRKAHSQGSCTCGDCGRSFRSPNAFRAHISVHSSKSCPSCDKIFRNQTCYFYHVKLCCNLERNRNNTHSKKRGKVEVKNKKSDEKIKVGMRGSTDKVCICDYCDKKYAGKKFISAHIQIVHMKNTHRPCIYCGKYLAAAHMTEHLKRHESVKIYKCDHCGITLKTKLGFIQHLRLHSGEKPYACQYCGETFSASSRRSEHIRKTHKSSGIVLRHACKQCPARFRLPYRLKKHIVSVHNVEKDDPQFECTQCHEKFASCRGLLHHSRTHQQPLSMVKKAKKEMRPKVYNRPW
ncbi:unnamed protein product [Parnassius apollo]|uniref:(apollo) hypothetical protein n=1 Tax=Parnassius apollo TaxID=110799 RepID=A0A8S3W2G8_PARAO|nr:unnamed protein product [Parnassius apollo]